MLGSGAMDEKKRRDLILTKKVFGILEHNMAWNNHTWEMGLNDYSDMTDEEFADYFHLVGDN